MKELEAPGILDSTETFNFSFENMDKPYESYIGLNAQVRYYLKVTISSHYGMNTVAKEEDVWIQNLGEAPPVNSSIKMEVGIEQCLHIEFEYDKSRYHLNDVVIGKVYFLLVRIKIKSMELAIIKREVRVKLKAVSNKIIKRFSLVEREPTLRTKVRHW